MLKAHFEQVLPLPENSFKVFLHEVHEFDAPWHYHPEYELTLILNSQGIRYVGNNMENFSEYRVNMASKLLIETDMQVAQISYACGCEGLPFFYRQFAKFSAMAPRSYRKQFQITTRLPETVKPS